VRDHLADELKKFPSFKSGDYVKALEDIYLHIDIMLKTPEGKQKLQKYKK
jgi:phage baseplate assembly protein W